MTDKIQTPREVSSHLEWVTKETFELYRTPSSRFKVERQILSRSNHVEPSGAPKEHSDEFVKEFVDLFADHLTRRNIESLIVALGNCLKEN